MFISEPSSLPLSVQQTHTLPKAVGRNQDTGALRVRRDDDRWKEESKYASDHAIALPWLLGMLVVKFKLRLLAYKAPGDLALTLLFFFITSLSPLQPLHFS